ncbi:hypothetical protein [Cytobacillus solani]|uniref:Uncharacterized protein n=1 Tax=Cytobacillus solani TaxID=1637975 RepID=A0A0Q3VIB3_9BACI|nr:hypothetical protein [Cytobacillus solani]KQL20475.1 hypothetical protein AN957_19045 [Cytobacillus solani]
MRVGVTFQLFKKVGDNMVAEKFESYKEIDVDTSYKGDLHQLIKVELAEVLGVPKQQFKVKTYKQI